MHIYPAELILQEHTYFASREIGSLFESEPLIGNYALTYALGLCPNNPYRLEAGSSGPRYHDDLAPLNQQGLYITPAGFSDLRMALTTFNGQSDSYYFRFDQNAIATTRDKTRANNFPQSGRIRMLGLGSHARFYLLDRDHLVAAGKVAQLAQLPPYIRLGKFMSKARVKWADKPITPQQVQLDQASVSGLLNAADLEDTTTLLAYSTYNIHPAPVLRDVMMRGQFWRFRLDNQDVYLPIAMQYGA